MDRFLIVAQRLKLEGLLTDPDADLVEEENIQGNEPLKDNVREDVTRYETKIKPNPSERHGKLIAKVGTDINPNNIAEVDEQVEQSIVKNWDGTYSCNICGKIMKHKSDMKRHIETHLEGLSFNCPMCEKTFRSRLSLAMHKTRSHK